MNKNVKYVLIATGLSIFIVGLGLTLFVLNKKMEGSREQNVVSNTKQVPSSTDTVKNGTKRFENPLFGVQFTYPEHWYVTPFVSHDAVNLCDTSTTGEGGDFSGTCIQISRNILPYAHSADAILQDGYSSNQNKETIAGTQYVVTSGVPKKESLLFHKVYSSKDFVVDAKSRSTFSAAVESTLANVIQSLAVHKPEVWEKFQGMYFTIQYPQGWQVEKEAHVSSEMEKVFFPAPSGVSGSWQVTVFDSAKKSYSSVMADIHEMGTIENSFPNGNGLLNLGQEVTVRFEDGSLRHYFTVDHSLTSRRVYFIEEIAPSAQGYFDDFVSNFSTTKDL